MARVIAPFPRAFTSPTLRLPRSEPSPGSAGQAFVPAAARSSPVMFNPIRSGGLAVLGLLLVTQAFATRIIVDNSMTSGTHVFTQTGSWTAVSNPSGYYGINYLLAAAGATSTAARWRPDIATAGYYDIYMKWTDGSPRANRAAIEINYQGGTKTDSTRRVNQTINGGVWVFVGTYYLSAGTGNSVRLLANADGNVAADAVLFELAHAIGTGPSTAASTVARLEYNNADNRLNPVEVEIVRTDSAGTGVDPDFALRINGAGYQVEGSCGHEAVAPISAASGNTIRVYSVPSMGANATAISDYLKAASDAGIRVLVGLWMTQPDVGSANEDFYEDATKVQNQFNILKAQIDAHKHHRAILAWCIGNEIDPSNHPNPGPIYAAIDQVARYIQDNDHYHPTLTSHAGSSQTKIARVKQWAYDIDIVGFNSYGASVGNIYTNVTGAGWKGPYLITEFNLEQPSGAPTNAFGSIIEPTSGEKYDGLLDTYADNVLAHTDLCLGSFVFKGALGGFRVTHTWYPILDENFTPTPSLDAMRVCWGGSTSFTAPKVETIKINGLTAAQNVDISGTGTFTSTVTVTADAGKTLQYSVEIRPDVGTNVNTPPAPVTGVTITQDSGDPRKFWIAKAGLAPGIYRLYYTVKQLNASAPNGYESVGTANIPFRRL